MLGYTYDEMVESLNRIADVGKRLVVVPRKERHSEKPDMPVMSDKVAWKKSNQIRLHLPVQNAIDLVVKTPRPVVTINLSEWTEGVHKGAPYVRHKQGAPCYYRPQFVPAFSKTFEPVLLGTEAGEYFAVDGAHRIKSCLDAKQATADAVILTEAETLSCVRPGKAPDYAQAFANKFP